MASTSGVADAATRSLSMSMAARLPYLELSYIAVLCIVKRDFVRVLNGPPKPYEVGIRLVSNIAIS